MGNTLGVPKDSPLGCILANWKKFKSGNLKKKKLVFFCNVSWPQYPLGDQYKWPENGSLNLNTVLQLDLFCKRFSKCLEIPYVEAFMKLCQDPKLRNSCQTYLASHWKKPDSTAPAASDSDPFDPILLTPPNLSPAALLDPLPPRQPVPCAEPLPCPPAPNPSAPSTQNPSPAAPSPARTQSGLPRPPPGTPPSFPPPPPPAHSLSPANSCLHREEVADGNGEIARVHKPFSLTDLNQCRKRFGSFSEDPDRFRDEFAKLSLTFTLTWQDVLAVLTHCCTLEEKALIWGKAREYADSLVATTPQHDVIRVAREAIPDQNFQWDYRDHLGQISVEHLITCVSEGMKRCQVKMLNYEKVWEITQEKEENPALFLNRLSEALRKYTNINPESEGGRILLTLHFRFQAAPDIQRKLEKLELRYQTPQSILVEAFKVFNNRDQAEEAKKYRRFKKETQPLASLIRPPLQEYPTPRRPAKDNHQGWSRVGPNQCAYCKREGHWKRDCLKKRRRENRECFDHSRKLGPVDNPSDKGMTSDWQGPNTAAPTLGNAITITPAERRVTLDMAGRKADFLLDTGAAYSVPTQLVGPLSNHDCTITRIDGKPEVRQPTFPLTCDTGSKTVDHSFLYVHECSFPLIGGDLITKLGASIFLQEDVQVSVEPEQGFHIFSLQTSPKLEPSTLPEDIRDQVKATVWDTSTPGRAINAEPVKIELKPGAEYPCQHQYPLRAEALVVIQPLLEKLIKHGLIRPCHSPCNTPVLLVKKPNGENHFVHDLRAVNKVVVPVHPAVPNPYTVLTQIPGETQYYTVLNLEDAFFCIPLHPDSQYLFAFEWKNPETHKVTQYTWTVLPPGFRDSPHLFRNALAKDLRELKLKNGMMLQYVNNLLIASTNYQDSQHNTIVTLSFLAERGYKVSPSKAQISLQKVQYLGFVLTPGAQWLAPDRKKAITSFPVPATKKELRSFLGTVEFCRIWIPNFGLIAKPLYEALKGKGEITLSWDEICQEAFETLKTKSDQAAELRLPDLKKPFFLYVHEKKGIALGVLTQKLGSLQRPVAYFSKQLDFVAQRWHSCLRAVAATAILVKDALKFTLGQRLEVFTPHQVQKVLEVKGHCLTRTRLTKYQALLLDTPNLTVRTCQTLNPETLLPVTEERDLEHTCVETRPGLCYSRPDSQD
ncbi:uncharacterized protein LOC105308688 [Pteropus vampyrus]|uniref:Uncharacterized protein LOC105308688 n=1 Tax=Pteropus vampyrus TaxID=132908 RepID=A0A6P6C270_PTEVA|nr:uncharacterized protein LOC105308688 [Pteropus vampyrus]